MNRSKWKIKTKAATFRSSLEKRVAESLTASLLKWEHESQTLCYVQPEQKRKYVPDFSLKSYPNILLEAKGQFTTSDRKKMLLIKEQHPNLAVIMVFGRASNPLRKGSPTTYADWCDKNGLLWIDVADFVKDPNTCLLSTIKKLKNGNSKTPVPKRSTRSSKSEKKLSSKAKRYPSRKRQ